MAPVAAPTPAPITAPLAVLLNLSFLLCGCRGGGGIIFRLIDYYSFLWVSTFVSTCMESITLCFSIATSMESTVAVFAASKSIFLDFTRNN
jgi:hypothetical protein